MVSRLDIIAKSPNIVSIYSRKFQKGILSRIRGLFSTTQFPVPFNHEIAIKLPSNIL